MKVKTSRTYMFSKQVVAKKAVKKALTHKTSLSSQSQFKQCFTCRKCNGAFKSRWHLLRHKCQALISNASMKVPKQAEEPSQIEKTPPQPVAKPKAVEQTETLNQIPSSEMEFECVTCRNKFSDLTALKCHRVSHLGYKPYVCQVCSTTFDAEIDWKNHIETSVGQSHCNECLQNFGCLLAKQQHICLENDFSCPECGISFKKQIALERHIEVCKLKTNCVLCGKSFSKECYLKRHINACHSNKTFNDEEKSNMNDSTETAIMKKVAKQNRAEPLSKDSEVKAETIRLNGPVSSLVMCSYITKSTAKGDDKLSCEICFRQFRTSRAKNIHRRFHALEKRGNSVLESDKEKCDGELNKNEVKLIAECEKCCQVTHFRREAKEACEKCGDKECSCENKTKYRCLECEEIVEQDITADLFCEKCQEIFIDESLYNDHMDGHNFVENSPLNKPQSDLNHSESGSKSELPFECESCSRGFKTKRDLSYHENHNQICKNSKSKELNRSSTPKPTQKDFSKSTCCLKCEKVFQNPVQFQQHLKTCLNVASQNLESEMNVQSNSELKRLHTTLNESIVSPTAGTGGSFECAKCLKVFRSQKHLELHEKQMHKEFQCKVCSLVCFKNEDLINHLKVHTPRQFACEICKAVSPNAMALRFHRVTHFGVLLEKSYVSSRISNMHYLCHHCKVRFNSFRKFEIHCKALAIRSDGVVSSKDSSSENNNDSKGVEGKLSAPRRRRLASGPARIESEAKRLKGNESEKDVNENNISQNQSTSTSSPMRVFHDTTFATYNSNGNVQSGDGHQLESFKPQRGPEMVAKKTAASDYSKYEPSLAQDLALMNQGKLQQGGVTDKQYGEMYDVLEQKLKAVDAYGDNIPLSVLCKSNVMRMTYHMMEFCLRSQGKHIISVHIRKLIREVFKRIVNGRVTAENPHKCRICYKHFTYPQGITNHYFRKHGAAGVIKSLKMIYCAKQRPLTSTPMFPQIGGFEAEIEDSAELPSENGTIEGVSWETEEEAIPVELLENFSKLLCQLVGDQDVLAELGWPERSVYDVLVDVIVRCERKPCQDMNKSLLERFRDNITILLGICVKEQAMEKFGWYTKPVEEVVKEMLASGEIDD